MDIKWQQMANFHRNIFSLSENIAKSLGGATFLTHTVLVITDFIKPYRLAVVQ